MQPKLVPSEPTAQNTLPSPVETVLRQRMKQLGIRSWSSLQQQTGLGRQALTRIRQGEWDSLRWIQLHKLATGLEWDLPTCLEALGILSGVSTSEPVSGSEREIQALRQECLHLRQAAKTQQSIAQQDCQQQTFQHLQTLLTSYPTACRMALDQPERPARHLVPLFRPLDALLAAWGIEPIGQPLQSVPFSAQVHQPDLPGIEVGDPVVIRFVGYRWGEKILCPAKVSRSLPGQSNTGGTP